MLSLSLWFRSLGSLLRLIQEKTSHERGVDTFEMNSKRNDAWLNSHCHSVIEYWRTDADFRLTVDLG
jgi:hypothetical protein